MKFLKTASSTFLFRLYSLRLVVIATLATFSAYSLANLAPEWISPTVAGIIALTGMKPTLHDTVRETIRQVVGTTVGAFLGLLLINWLGFNSFTLLVIVAIGLLVGVILNMDMQGTLTISATVLLVAGPLLGSIDNVEERIAGVALGAVFAFIGSILLTRRNPHKQILEELVKIGRVNSKLVLEISNVFQEGEHTIETANAWLEQIEGNIKKLADLRDRIQTVYQDARWSPLLKKAEIKKVRHQAFIMKQTAENIRSIVQAIINSLEHDVVLPTKASNVFGSLLREIGEAVKEQSKIAATNPSGNISLEREQVLREKRKKVANEIRKMDDTRAIMLGGSLIHEATNIKDALTDN